CGVPWQLSLCRRNRSSIHDGAIAQLARLSLDRRRLPLPAPLPDFRLPAVGAKVSAPSPAHVCCFLPQHLPLYAAFAGSSGLPCRVDRRHQTARSFQPAQTESLPTRGARGPAKTWTAIAQSITPCAPRGSIRLF